MIDYIFEMIDITKDFSGVVVLDKVNLKVKRNEIHALVGENGAGKSTLMKILCGVYSAKEFQGEIILEGEHKRFNGIKDSEKAGIGIIHQELELVPDLSIAENIFLGHYPSKNGNINLCEMNNMARQLLDRVNLDINPETLVKDIGIGKMQLVSIAKALSHKVKILLLDEPTAALTESETENLFQILREIQKEGISCVYISHKLNEILSITNNVTIMRDGESVITVPTQELDEETIIKHMVGREIKERFPYQPRDFNDVVFEVKNYSFFDYDHDKKIIDDVSFNVRSGEIVGIAGLMGAGRTELIMSMFGMMNGHKSGAIYLNDEPLEFKNPKDAIRNGIGIVSEDRKNYGLVLSSNIYVNTTLSCLNRISKYGVINKNLEISKTIEQVKNLSVKASSLETETMHLSGGNQQKVILGKVLMSRPDILFLDEPTRGIDVGAKHDIYLIMNELAKKGVAIVMISSELPEILGMSDRIIVMNEGRITGEIARKEATQERVMMYATSKRRKTNGE